MLSASCPRRNTVPHSQIRFTVEATAAAVHSARHRVSRAVRSWTASSDDELSFRLELVASELLTNGLEHAGGPMLVEVVLDAGLLVIAVHDGSSTKPQPCDADVDDERGRGLALIEALCLFQGSDRTTAGKRCWAALPAASLLRPEVKLRHDAQDGGTEVDQARWSVTPAGEKLLSSIFPSI
ncbi:ATP-binding protein [Streptomyces longwoodensis]|uniref:ATP-binding protein n=1 Tax=Streptomyces longwoodensis TaxID=68231 RepID=UPI002E7FB4A0|nr:ATP-binding protein [Streptomyces longwoodensis]